MRPFTRRALSTALCAIFGASALIVGPTPSLLTGAAAQATDPTALFQTGVELYRNKQYQDAINIFRQVFELDPNPFVLYNIGRCHEELGQLEEAVKYYQRALLLDGLPQEAKAEALKRLEKLEPQLKDNTAPDIDTQVSREMVRTVLGMALSRAEQSAATASGNTDKNIKDPDKSPAEARGAATWLGVTALVVGAGTIAAGTVFSVSVSDGISTQNDLERDYESLRAQALGSGDPDTARRALRTAAEIDSLADDIEREQTASMILLGVGGVLLANGVVLILIDSPEEDTSETSSVDLWLAPAPGGIGIGGQW